MRILVTGSEGFIGSNLVAELKTTTEHTVYEYNRNTDPELLDFFCKKADFIFHLAGVNRPENKDEYMKENFGFSSMLLSTLKKHNNNCPVMVSSSIQAETDNPYGRSKKAGEDLLKEYSHETGAPILIYRFPNVFGKWSKPNYNSVISTFCYNIAREIPIQVNNENTELTLVYIDDLVYELMAAIEGKATRVGDYYQVPIEYRKKLGEIAELIYSFKNSRSELSIPNMKDTFIKKLYSTYTSFLPEDNFSYDLKMNVDERGSFTEVIRTLDRGQVSINISKPGIIKGNHWHHTKNEKFLVVSGEGVIRFRKINTKKVIEYFVSGEKLQVVDIPVGYTHNIENLGEENMVTLMWVNELFNPQFPDTFFEEV